MSRVEQLVEKYRKKLLVDEKVEKYKMEIINPLADKVFSNDFAGIFCDLASEINDKLGCKIISYQQEGKNRFVIEGQHHRIYFQRSKPDVSDGIAGIHIVPIYIWKGVTKHLSPIFFFIEPDSREVRWDISFGSVEDYITTLFSNLVDDKDFFM
ncbi:MAG: hypothetical protein A2104_01900 [Candidatus Melainabacteria bacterium GWF2_32_7]|nr:MAG: hypothetical protein A2104_01900 [Candidatus Melainabacteria bacterium GWF2_32_7]OGI17808.1 MAG: hypothetical protein A2255_04650 [Candidatus Melainabacteria bacterium RIFOXYA2_FULL_32_9]